MTTYSYDAFSDTVASGGSSLPSNTVNPEHAQLTVGDYSNVQSVHMTTDPSNIMTSGRNNGMPVPAADWTDDTVIEYAGMTMRAGEAVMAGVLEKSRDGYRPVSTEGVRQAEQDQKNWEDDTPPIERLDDESETILTDMVDTVAATERHMAMDAMIDGELSDSIVGTVATHMGILPEEARAKMDHVKAAFEEQAIRAVERTGIPDGRAFFEWLSETDPEGYRNAVRTHVMDGTVEQYAEPAFEYLATIDKHDPKAALAAVEAFGHEGHFDSNGNLLIKHDRMGYISWEVFVRGATR